MLRRAAVAVGALLSSAWLWAGAAVPEEQEPLPSGQMLVKFVSGDPADTEITRLLNSGELASAALDDYVQALATSLRVPLFVRQITSGREAILELERNEILETTAARVSAADGV